MLCIRLSPHGDWSTLPSVRHSGFQMNHIRQVFFCLCVSLVAGCGGGGGSSAPSITVTVSPAIASVMVAQQIQLTATTTNTTGPVTWSSSNTAVATVDSTGLVMTAPSSQGKVVTITATSGETSGTATLSITLGIAFSNVSAGSNHTCGVGGVNGSSGAYDTAYCWGDNSSGQLGNGTTTNSATPIPVSGGLSFSTVVAGGNQTCGVTTAGAAYCWGDNSSGQLGNGTTISSTTPTPVSGGLVFDGVSVGGKHVCGDGYCWGDNSFGQLGNGTMTNSSVPVPITTGDISGGAGYYNGISYVSAGSSHTCGIAGGNDGFIVYLAAVCWGNNSSGQLGNGTTTNSAVPVALSGGPGFVIFSAGTLFTCAYNLPASSCWGTNGVGQLGNGTMTNSTTPVIISGGLNIALISSGGMHSCGVGGVPGPPYPGAYCWGDNSSGQLGNGTMTNSATPVAVVGNLGFVTVSTGGGHTCGNSGILGGTYCWGDNTFGQLGNSWTTSSSIPINVAGGP
jgi:alpha-tubulin suppressor-like RCC1 family protein